MERLTVNNSELAQSLSYQKHNSVQPSKEKGSRIYDTKCVKLPNEASETWKDNFVLVFLDLITRLGRVEGFVIPKEFSLRRKIKACWRYLKQFIRFCRI